MVLPMQSLSPIISMLVYAPELRNCVAKGKRKILTKRQARRPRGLVDIMVATVPEL